jgi:hypothetical protein
MMSYINYIAVNCAREPIYLISNAQGLIIVAWFLSFCFHSAHHPDFSSSETVKFLGINFISVFMGLHFPMIIIVSLWIERQISNCYNYTIIMSLLSKCIWWWLGNRYEYSGVDILKTYVYSDKYAVFLNGLSLVVYLNSPFILNLILINCRAVS